MARPNAPAPLLPLLKANLILAGILHGVGTGIFLLVTLPMQNQFARYVREEAPWLALEANLRVLPGYLLLALAFTFLGYPLLALWRVRVSGLAGLARLGALNLGILALSLGAAQTLNPGILDAAVRYASPLLPGADLLWVYSTPALVVLRVGFFLLLAAAVLAWCLRFPRSVVAVTASVAALWLFAHGRDSSAQQGPRAHEQAAGPVADGPASPRRPNVLLLASDSLRADHLSCYGYERATSADHIDRLAQEGVRFEQMTVATASTLEGWATILGSRYPRGHGLRYMFIDRESAERVSHDADLLPRVLDRAGYHTFVTSDWAGNCFRLVDMGFTENHAADVQNLNVFVAEAALLAHTPFVLFLNNALGELIYPEIRQFTGYLNPRALLARTEREIAQAQRSGKPFFGVLFSATTHLPYAASYPWNTRWVDPAYRGPNRFQIDFQVDEFMRDGFRDRVPPRERQHIIDLYDGTVSDFDAMVGSALQVLQRQDALRDTIVILLSDHGDDLYEEGTTLGHGHSFFGGDQTTRIPFIIRFPDGRYAGRQVPWVTRSVDIAPTILSLLGISPPASHVGVDLTPAMQDPDAPLDLPAFAETCYLFYPKRHHPEGALTVKSSAETLTIDPGFRNNLVLRPEYHQAVIDSKDRMMRTNRWKLIEIPGEKGPIHRLYDMTRDPGQATDLSMSGLEVLDRLAAALKAWWEGQDDLRWSIEDDESR